MITINDKVYGLKSKPLAEPEKVYLELLRGIVVNTIEEKRKLVQEGLHGFGEDSEQLYLAKISEFEEKIERLSEKIASYEARQRKPMEVSLHMSEEDSRERRVKRKN